MRKSRVSRFVGFGLVAVFATACANGPCHPLKHPELAQQAVPAGQTSPAAEGGAMNELKAGEGRIFVYKPDGSLQCGMAKGESPQEMEKLLEGIKVYSRENRADGKMHIQVCGSPTGRVNIYEIPATSLKDAEKRGFKKFDPGT